MLHHRNRLSKLLNIFKGGYMIINVCIAAALRVMVWLSRYTTNHSGWNVDIPDCSLDTMTEVNHIPLTTSDYKVVRHWKPLCMIGYH